MITLIFDIGTEHEGGVGLKNLFQDKVPSVNQSFLATQRKMTPDMHVPWPNRHQLGFCVSKTGLHYQSVVVSQAHQTQRCEPALQWL